MVYYHVVFPPPRVVGNMATQNKRLIYGLLFKTAAETLQQVAKSHLGIELGVLAVLHTWGQNLQHHPHVHCVVPYRDPFNTSNQTTSLSDAIEFTMAP